MSTVLVTGGSGFIAGHCILTLLAAGHQVRTTVRSLKHEGPVRAVLTQAGADPGDRLSFIAANLEHDAGWPQAVEGCEYVLHVASPLSAGAPRNEDKLIVPAREGTLRVLRAARMRRARKTAGMNAHRMTARCCRSHTASRLTAAVISAMPGRRPVDQTRR